MNMIYCAFLKSGVAIWLSLSLAQFFVVPIVFENEMLFEFS